MRANYGRCGANYGCMSSFLGFTRFRAHGVGTRRLGRCRGSSRPERGSPASCICTFPPCSRCDPGLHPYTGWWDVMQAPTGALSLSSVDFFDLRNKSGESGIMRSFRARFASCRHTAARSMIVARYDQDDLTNKAQCSQTLREVQCSPCLRQHQSRRLQLQGDDLIAE